MSQVTVKLDRAHLMAKLKNAKESCGAAVAEQILGDSKPYTPKDQGMLEDSGRVERIDDNFAVTYGGSNDTVYAAYQYYGCWPDGSHVIQNHDLSKNAKATTQWIEAAKREHGKHWNIVAQQEHVKGFK